MQKTRKHIKSSLVVSSMTGLSRILGLIRDICFAGFFGASSLTDVFFIAFKIPNFLRRLFAEGAFAQAFIPVLAEYRKHHSFIELKQFIGATANSLAIILFGLSLLVIIFSQWVSYLFAPGFWDDPIKLELVSQALQITFPYLFFIALTAFAGSILNCYQQFAIPATAPVILNLCLIGATVLSVYFQQPVIVLSWAVCIAGVLQLLLHVPFLMRLQLLPRPGLNFMQAWQNPGVKKIITLMLPTLFAVSVTQISLFIDTMLASFLAPGSVSWLYYADRLVELPLGILAIAIATVILPSLSSKHQEQDITAFVQTLAWAMRVVWFVGLPAAMALTVMAEPIIKTLFGYQAMTGTDITQTAASLRAYSLGLVAFMLIKISAPAYFSRHNARTPVKIAIIASVTNIVLSLVLIIPLAHTGLALATSLSALLNAGLLIYGLRKSNLVRSDKADITYYVKTFTASLIMALFLCIIQNQLSNYFNAHFMVRWLVLSGCCLGGVLIYMLTSCILGLRKSDLIY